MNQEIFKFQRKVLAEIPTKTLEHYLNDYILPGEVHDKIKEELRRRRDENNKA